MLTLIRSLSRIMTSAPRLSEERHERARARVNVEALEGKLLLSGLGIHRNTGMVDTRLIAQTSAMVSSVSGTVARPVETLPSLGTPTIPKLVVTGPLHVSGSGTATTAQGAASSTLFATAGLRDRTARTVVVATTTSASRLQSSAIAPTSPTASGAQSFRGTDSTLLRKGSTGLQALHSTGAMQLVGLVGKRAVTTSVGAASGSVVSGPVSNPIMIASRR